MQARQLIALTVSLILTGGSLALFGSASYHTANIHHDRSHFIEGKPVVDLPPIIVRPTPEEIRDAFASPEEASISNSGMTTSLAGSLSPTGSRLSSGSLISATFAMPYYSFGTRLGTISKD